MTATKNKFLSLSLLKNSLKEKNIPNSLLPLKLITILINFKNKISIISRKKSFHSQSKNARILDSKLNL